MGVRVTSYSAVRPKRWLVWAVAACLAWVVLAGTPTTASAREPVRVAFFSWPGYGFWFIAKEKDFAPDLDLQISLIEDPYESLALMKAGRMDVISSTAEYAPIAAETGHPARLVSISNLSYGTDRIIVGPGVRQIADLKGQSVAVLEGGLSQIYMGIFLEQNGVGFDDVRYVNLVMDDAAAAMIGGQTAAGEFWEPYGSQVLANLRGSRVVAQSREPNWLRSALLADAVYMHRDFVRDRPDVAAKALRAYFDAVAFWMANPAEGNRIIAEGLKFDVADVVATVGDEGKSREGGLYVYDLPEAARFMGVEPGEPPFGQTNGQVHDHFRLTNTWWKKFGLVEREHDPVRGVDASVLARVVGRDDRTEPTATGQGSP